MLPAGTALEHDETVESGAPLAMWRPHAHAAPGDLAAVQIEVQVDLKPPPDRAELERRWAGIDQRIRDVRLERADLIRSVHRDSASAHHPVWLWRLGDCAVVAHPGEAYSALQIALRRRFARYPVLVLNHSNAPTHGPGWVYIPDAQAYGHDIYQVWHTLYAQGSLERITQRIGHALEADLGFDEEPALR
jgi:hypothetical protein